MSRWYAAAAFPTLQTAGECFSEIERNLLAIDHPPDCAGYRFMADDAFYVAVISDKPERLSHDQRQLIARALNAGIRRSLDAGVLGVLFDDWTAKRGDGPPVFHHGRYDLIAYQPQGEESEP